MRDYTVVFTPEANEDFDNIIDYIAKDSPERALSFVRELQERTKGLCCKKHNGVN